MIVGVLTKPLRVQKDENENRMNSKSELESSKTTNQIPENITFIEARLWQIHLS